MKCIIMNWGFYSNLRRSISTFFLVTFAVVTVLALASCDPMVTTPQRPLQPQPQPKQVHVLPDDEDLGTVGDDVLSFRQPVSYNKGDVIVAGITDKTPHGMLREVTAVSADKRTVETKYATMEDVIAEGPLLIEGQLETDYDMSCTEFSNAGASLALAGTISYSLEYRLKANFKSGVENVEFWLKPNEAITLRVTAACSAAAQTEDRLRIPIQSHPATIMVGNVPVVYTPQLDLFLGLKFDGSASVDVDRQGAVKVGAQCTDRCGESGNWRPINEIEQAVVFKTFGVTLEASAVEAYVAPRLTFRLYEAVGPHVEVRSFLRVGEQNELKAGIGAIVGTHDEVPILGATLQDVTLEDFDGYADADNDSLLDVYEPQTLWPPPDGTVFQDCRDCPEMVVVEADSFDMGSPDSYYTNERPVHQVNIKGFAVGTKEMTFNEWDACKAGEQTHSPCTDDPDDNGWGRGTRPVINVNWGQAQSYVTWLSSRTGATYRLPSESEWEYVARAGTTTLYHTGDTISKDDANYGTVSGGKTVVVGSYAANAFGLFDVHGNVWEWTQDCWHKDYDEEELAPADGTAWVIYCTTPDTAVMRGGSYGDFALPLRSSNRVSISKESAATGIGFRVARDL